MADHLNSAQIRKMGLRMFFSHHGNTDITQRMELGSSSFTPQVTYQIDRGRLENELTRRCIAEGVEIISGRVTSVDFGAGDNAHTIQIQRGDDNSSTTARWVLRGVGFLLRDFLSAPEPEKRRDDLSIEHVWRIQGLR